MTLTKTLTRIGNGTTLHLPLTMAPEDTLPRMRTMVVVVVGMAVIPILIRTAATDGPHSPRTMIITIGMRLLSTLHDSAMIEDIHSLATMKRCIGMGIGLDDLFPATAVEPTHCPETMVMDTRIIEAGVTPRAGHTQFTTTMCDKQTLITTPITTVPPTVHLETLDPPSWTITMDIDRTQSVYRMAETDSLCPRRGPIDLKGARRKSRASYGR